MQQGRNYQPVMIRTLNQNHGEATKEKIIQELQKFNSTYPISHFNDCPVFGVLQKHNVVKFNPSNETYQMLDYDEIDTFYGRKANITKLCDNKIENGEQLSSDSQFFLVQVTQKGSDNLINNGYYEHPDWDYSTRNADHGKVKVGDLLLVYFGYKAIEFNKNLKIIYKVNSISDDKVRFTVLTWKELNGISSDELKHAVDVGKLGEKFHNISSQGFNISQIPKSDFDTILSLDGSKVTVSIDDEKFQFAHKLFEQEMLKRSDGIAFENFEHPGILDGEINYKREILDKTKHLRSIDNWHDWQGLDQILIQIRDACSQSVFKNLLIGNNYGVEASSAASLFTVPVTLEKELEEKLFYFFTTAIDAINEFPKQFDALIKFLKSNNLKVDWRFLSYLAYIANPEELIHVHPTRFEQLLQFYGIDLKLRARFSWELYSIILQTATALKSKLAKYGTIDNTQIHSYIWITSPLVENVGETNYWMIRPGTSGYDWDNQRENSFIGLHYYTIKDLDQIVDNSNDPENIELRKRMNDIRIKEGKDELTDAEFRSDLGQYKKFLTIKKEDKVIAIGNNSTLLGVGEVTGDYQFKEEYENCHTYPVNWEETTKRTIPTQSFQKTIKQLTPEEYEGLTSTTEITTEIPSEYEEYSNMLVRKKQLIFYGPPGTGKTFTAKKFANWFVSTNESGIISEETESMSDEQFNNHVLNRFKNLASTYHFDFVKEPGSFNLYSLQNSERDIRIVFVFSKSEKNVKNDVWCGVSPNILKFWSEVSPENRFHVLVNNDTKSFVVLPFEIEQKYARFRLEQSHLEEIDPEKEYDFHTTINENDAKLPTREGTYGDRYYDLNQNLNNLESLGIGSEVSKVDFVRNVTFHPSYSYEEFVEGMKPKSRGDHVEYPIENGIFKTICEDAKSDHENKYVLIIDEINRGNISKILGELITLLEKDKRDPNHLILTYSKKQFSVPNNLYIIGTMNTADRSLTQLDVALRRRFAFVELMPDVQLLNKTIEGVHLGTLLDTLNEKIRKEGLREKQIGHSYFMEGENAIESIEDLQFVFANEIIPLLQDYFYEDYEKIRQILGSKFVNEKEMMIRSEWKYDDALFIDALKEIIANE